MINNNILIQPLLPQINNNNNNGKIIHLEFKIFKLMKWKMENQLIYKFNLNLNKEEKDQCFLYKIHMFTNKIYKITYQSKLYNKIFIIIYFNIKYNYIIFLKEIL